MPPPKGLVPIALVLAALSLAQLLRSHGSSDRRGDGALANGADGADGAAGARRRLPLMELMGMAPIVDGGAYGGSEYPYSVLVVSYHKTGHDLQMDLLDYLTSSFPGVAPNMTEHGNLSLLLRRSHRGGNDGCPPFRLISGTIGVQHAPDLFCSPESVAKMLLTGGRWHKGDDVDRGVKVVHLVRNPFSMAVSNYHYHAQIPTPEPWVRSQNPCEVLYDEDASQCYADMVLPALSKPVGGMGFGGQSLVSREEFDAVLNDCLSLYQTQPKLENANFFGHLMNFDAPEGLRLATAEMTIQGYHNGGDILRMANNMVKLKQAQMMVKYSEDYRKRGKELQVYTMSLDDFIESPGESALKFFDFVLGRQNPRVSQMEKEAAATMYQQHYLEKKEASRHITQGKTDNTDQLVEYLRHDPVFGTMLTKIELLVETALEESRNNY